jgi:hypothetical protein
MSHTANSTHNNDYSTITQHGNITDSRQSDDSSSVVTISRQSDDTSYIVTESRQSDDSSYLTTNSQRSDDTSYLTTDSNISNSYTTFDTDETNYKKPSIRLASKSPVLRGFQSNDNQNNETGKNSIRDSIIIYNSSLKKKGELSVPDDMIISLAVSKSMLYASSSSKIFKYNNKNDTWKTVGAVENHILSIYDINNELGVQTKNGNYILNSDKKNPSMKKTIEHKKIYSDKTILIDKYGDLLQCGKSDGTYKKIANKVTCFDCDDNNICYVSGGYLNIMSINKEPDYKKISGFGSAICINNGNIYLYTIND